MYEVITYFASFLIGTMLQIALKDSLL